MLGQVERALRQAWNYQLGVTPAIKHADQLDVVIVLGDPDDEHLVARSAGYLGMGGIPGCVLLVCGQPSRT